MQVAFDRRQPIDDVLDGALDGFQRIPRAPIAVLDCGDVALDRVRRRRHQPRAGRFGSFKAAHLLDVHKQVGKPALDGFEMS
jgi:hypothetical protein